ncbi:MULTISPECIES: porin [unclassified Caballeronia]|uniref:porin n=1 Tax=unclassified Caballeronia TaxID=2646786 RepID=UPI003ED0AE52
MKKSIVAFAVLGSFGAVAHAQGSVTLYGIIDEAAVYTSNVKTGGANTAASPNVGGKRFWLDSTNGVSGSRWGLRGEENLGGGLSAVFLLENAFNLNNGALGNGGLEFGRQEYVGLSDKRYGTFTMGRQYDPITEFIGPATFSDTIGSSYAALPGDVNGQTVGQRINNSVKYRSPVLYGVSFEALYGFGGVAGSVARNQIYSFGLGYALGPVALAAAILHVNQPNTSYFSNSAIAAGSLGTATSSITTTSTPVFGGYVSANSYQSADVSATYQVGPAKIGLIYSNTKFSDMQSSLAGSGLTPSATGAQGTAIFNAIEANLTWQWTPSFLTGVAYSYTRGSSVRFGRLLSNGTHDTGGVTYNQVSVSALYALSKRTDLTLVGVYQIASGIDSTGTSATAGQYLAGGSTNNREALVRAGIRVRF